MECIIRVLKRVKVGSHLKNPSGKGAATVNL